MNALSWICVLVMVTCAFLIGYGTSYIQWVNRLMHLCDGLGDTVKATQDGLKIIEKQVTDIASKVIHESEDLNV